MASNAKMQLKDPINLIKQGPLTWNSWRKAHPTIYPVLDGIQLVGLDLQGIDFSGLSIRHANIKYCDLSKASLISANCEGSILFKNNLNAAKLIAAHFTKADMRGCTIAQANILTATVKGATLDGIDFRGHDLRGLDLRNTSLKGANLSGQFLVRADLSGAKMDQCSLNNTDISHANLTNCSLNGVDFSASKLDNTHFKYAQLKLSSFRNCQLEEVDFSGADLSEADFSESDLSRANLSGANLSGCKLWKTKQTDWNVSKIICSHAYWDKDAKKKTQYNKFEFERIYAKSITVTMNYPFRLSANEISTLPILIEHLKASFWGTQIRLKNIEDIAGGAQVTLAVDETGRFHPSELKDNLQDEANRLQHALIALRQDTDLQRELKEEIASIKEKFWPRLLELASENDREHVRNLTILFMDLKGFSSWADDEISEKLALFRGLVKPILSRWHAGHPNMEGDSLRVTFRNATAGLACASMLRNVLLGAGFELRMGVELGEVSVVHNEVTDISDLEGSAVSMAARLEASASQGEILATENVRQYAGHKGFFEFQPRRIELKKSIGEKQQGDTIECYSITQIAPLLDIT